MLAKFWPPSCNSCRRARVVKGMDSKPIVISRAGSNPAVDVSFSLRHSLFFFFHFFLATFFVFSSSVFAFFSSTPASFFFLFPSKYLIDCSALHRASNFLFLFHKRDRSWSGTQTLRDRRDEDHGQTTRNVPGKIIERCRRTRATSTIYCGCSAINRT